MIHYRATSQFINYDFSLHIIIKNAPAELLWCKTLITLLFGLTNTLWSVLTHTEWRTVSDTSQRNHKIITDQRREPVKGFLQRVGLLEFRRTLIIEVQIHLSVSCWGGKPRGKHKQSSSTGSGFDFWGKDRHRSLLLLLGNSVVYINVSFPFCKYIIITIFICITKSHQ